MNVQPWILGGFAVLVGMQAVVLAYASRRPEWRAVSTDPGEQPGERSTGSVGSDAVACRECGTSNDSDYCYCRACVAALPGEVRVTSRAARAEPPEVH